MDLQHARNLIAQARRCLVSGRRLNDPDATDHALLALDLAELELTDETDEDPA